MKRISEEYITAGAFIAGVAIFTGVTLMMLQGFLI